MIIRKREFDFKNNAYIMGILNVTPDSFSDGGKYDEIDKAIQKAKEMISEGADIIDIGGESTRPGHTPISAEEEINRVVPVIKAIRNFSDCVISIDSYKSETLEAAFQSGADIANDIWGLVKDPLMTDIIKKYEVPVIIMHNKEDNLYDNLIEDMINQIKNSIRIAKSKGIHDDKIIIDPGIGFALSYEKDLIVLNNLERFTELGYPVLLGTSRKRFIGKATDVEIASDRIIGTCATTVLGRIKGASLFRVHDIKENLQALKMTDAILREGR
ncbi:MAG: dihydropteroate synthase [Tissierellia bacterium]|nr:dihydropteroate synthase [Tissierellia bacterium]